MTCIETSSLGCCIIMEASSHAIAKDHQLYITDHSTDFVHCILCNNHSFVAFVLLDSEPKCNFPAFMTDQPTRQTANGHKGSQGSYSSNKSVFLKSLQYFLIVKASGELEIVEVNQVNRTDQDLLWRVGVGVSFVCVCLNICEYMLMYICMYVCAKIPYASPPVDRSFSIHTYLCGQKFSKCYPTDLLVYVCVPWET